MVSLIYQLMLLNITELLLTKKERMYNNKGRNIKYPLIEWGITENQALEYCYSRGLDWNGLYEKFHRVSCWCCPLSRIGELRVLYNDFPILWKELQEMDKKSSRKFRIYYSVAELTEKFANENLLIELPFAKNTKAISKLNR